MESVGKIVADTVRWPHPTSDSNNNNHDNSPTTDATNPLAPEVNRDSELQTLTELVFAKTGGNAFFVTQLLRSLHRGGHIWFDFDRRQWRFNLTSLDADELPPTVVDLLVGQMMSLDEETRDIMKIAACLGSDKMSLHVLAIASGRSLQDTAQHLWGALNVTIPVILNSHRS